MSEIVRCVRCQCGLATGEQCLWIGPIEETVVVEFMPEAFRQSHQAANNKGRWPANGAIRFRAEQSCAETLVDDHGGEWVEILGQDAILLEEEGEEQ